MVNLGRGWGARSRRGPLAKRSTKLEERKGYLQE